MITATERLLNALDTVGERRIELMNDFIFHLEAGNNLDSAVDRAIEDYKKSILVPTQNWPEDEEILEEK